MLPAYCTFILISTLISNTSSTQVDAEPQFSPLTPYQSADSLPPPVYGFLEERPDIDATLIASKSVDNWRNYYASKQKESDEILGSPSKKRSSSKSSKNAQLKNWKVPPGAKLIGYNVQMIAGYIPTTYLNNSRQKGDKGRLESQDSEAPLDTYSEYIPGYSLNTVKNYEVKRKDDKLDTVAVGADSLENDIDDELLKESIVHTNLTLGKSRFLGEREESINSDTTNTNVGVVDLDAFLWPVVEAEQREESISVSEVDRSITESNKKLGATAFVGPIEHELSNSPKNVSITKTTKPDSRNSKDGLEDDPISLFQSTVATSMLENSTSVPGGPQLRGGLGKVGQDLPFFQQFLTKLQTNYTDGLAALMTKEPLEIAVSQASPGRSLPFIIPKTNAQHRDIDRNQPTTETIIRITTEPSGERERAVVDTKRQSDVHVISPASSQNSTSMSVTVPRSTILNVDSFEFDDEDKALQNEDGNSFPRRENPEFPKIQPANEQRRDINEKLHPEQGSRDVNGNDDHEEWLQSAKFLESNGDGGDGQWPQGKLTEVKSSGEGVNSRNTENFRDDYGEGDGDDDNHDDGVHDDVHDDEDRAGMIKENDDEVSRSSKNSEEKQGRVDVSMFFPRQIPTFEEWLSNLPIQPAFPFGAKNSMWNQSPANRNHQPFFRPFREGSDDEESRQEGQRLAADPDKKQEPELNVYDDFEDEDKGQFEEERFALPRNVPYE